jgi:hypothetical protein
MEEVTVGWTCSSEGGQAMSTVFCKKQVLKINHLETQEGSGSITLICVRFQALMVVHC